jgi:catechol 2,3-dioxygenase-like lactoylglutathione lyase family enzyme
VCGTDRSTGPHEEHRHGREEEMKVDYKLELVLIPVSDVDRAKRFYVEQAGFDLLVDGGTGLPGQRVVQVNPPGSACSIGFGTGMTPGMTPAAPGSQQGLHLVVPDIVAARDELAGRGVEIGEVQHIADGAWRPGPDPQRRSYMSFAEFADPDGNLLLLQEVRRDQDGQEGDDR